MSQPVSYQSFKQRVRRHRRSELLRSLAALAAQMHHAEFDNREPLGLPGHVTQFALAGIARTALISNNEHRDPGLGLEDIVEMCALYINIEDPALQQDPGQYRLRTLLNRIAYEQFGYQYSLMENVGRTLPLLTNFISMCRGAPSLEDWQGVLGVNLETFVRVGFALHVAFIQNGGTVPRDLLRADHVVPIFSPLDIQDALRLIDRFFAATPEELRGVGSAEEQPGFEKWSFNPLVAKPVVALDDSLVAPIPRLVIERVTPAGLYFDALGAWARSFTDALGCMFERYVGQQLNSLSSVQVLPEVILGKPERKSVDYFLVTPEVVVLVEAKASRPALDLRLGREPGDEDFAAKIGKAISQINETHDLLKAEHPALGHIPKNRPYRGLVVSLEPFHFAETFLYGDLLGRPRIPTAIASSHELEGFIGVAHDRPDVGALLITGLTGQPPTPPSLHLAVDHIVSRANPILAKSWERFTEIYGRMNTDETSTST